MVILIVNREHRIEFKYNSDCEKFIEELHSSLSDVHFQTIHKSENYVYVVNHDALVNTANNAYWATSKWQPILTYYLNKIIQPIPFKIRFRGYFNKDK